MDQLGHPNPWATLCAGLVGIFFIGMVFVWGTAIWRLSRGQSLFPREPLVKGGRARWGVGTIALVSLLYVGVSLLTQWAYMAATFRGRAADPPGPAAPLGPAATPAAGNEKRAEIAAADGPREIRPAIDSEPLAKTEVMFLIAVSESLLVVLVPLLVRLTSGARLRDLGLAMPGWPVQALYGVAATLFVAPLVYMIQAQVLKIWPADSETEHPLQTMLGEQFTPGVAYLAVLSAVVLAPLFEEMVFRALFQGWLCRVIAGRGHDRARVAETEAMAGPDSVREVVHEGDHAAAMPAPAIAWETPLSPLIAPAAPPAPLAPPRPRPMRAVVLTSLFFASVHLPQWPAPIAIFVLSLALGTVYQRTGSLIASVCMHATFNAFSTLVLIWGMLGGEVGQARGVGREKAVGKARPVAISGVTWYAKSVATIRE